MFLRKEIKQIKTGTLLVPFCKDCGSQEIETIQTCKRCGSHNTTADWSDTRSQRPQFDEREYSIYKCDKCGKEYESKIDENIISYDGEFNPFSCHEDEYGGYDFTNYNIGYDLCDNCKEKVVNRLNAQLSRLISCSNVREIIEDFVGKGDN